MIIPRELLTVPNLLTSFRFFCAPILLIAAWHNQATAFFLILAFAFLSDVLDGMTARLTGQVTHLGAVLDSWADMTTYLTVTLSAWWLWPEVVRREGLYVGILIASYLMPVVVGFIKFRALTSYHTWMVKFAAFCVGMSFYLLFLGGLSLPFHIAIFVCVLAATEEILITLISTKMPLNVRSVWDIIRTVKIRSS